MDGGSAAAPDDDDDEIRRPKLRMRSSQIDDLSPGNRADIEERIRRGELPAFRHSGPTVAGSTERGEGELLGALALEELDSWASLGDGPSTPGAVSEHEDGPPSPGPATSGTRQMVPDVEALKRALQEIALLESTVDDGHSAVESSTDTSPATLLALSLRDAAGLDSPDTPGTMVSAVLW